MEWRIILPVLCLIGILHLPGFVVSQGSTAPTTAATTPTTTATTSTTAATTPTTAASATTPTTAASATTPTTAASATTPTTAASATTPTTAASATTPTTAASATTPTTAASATTPSTAASATTPTTAASATTPTTAASATTHSTVASAGTNQATTASTPAYLGLVNLNFKLNETFKAAYSDLNNAETKAFVENIKSQFYPVYKKRFPNYFGMIVNQLSAGSVNLNSTLQFDTTNSSAPNATDTKDTLVQAINSGTLNLTVDNTSITAVQITSNASSTTATTSASNVTGSTSSSTGGNSTAATNQTATASTPASLGLVNLIFKLNDTFQEYYNNLTDARTKLFVENIKTQFFPVYKKRYPNYFGMIINQLRAGSVNISSTLQFDTTSSSAPNATDVRDTLIQAINSGSINLTIDNTSITAEQVSSNGTNTTATTQTTTATTTALVLANYNITFKMLTLFTSDLANLSSIAGSALKQAVSGQMTVFFNNFKGFYQTDVWRFRNGSIIVEAWVAFFKNINTPNATDLAKQFAAAVRNQTFFFTIDPTSVNITDFTGFTANKSPVLASMLTALWMTLASLLFSAVMH